MRVSHQNSIGIEIFKYNVKVSVSILVITVKIELFQPINETL